jgi:hypothetical protein
MLQPCRQLEAIQRDRAREAHQRVTLLQLGQLHQRQVELDLVRPGQGHRPALGDEEVMAPLPGRPPDTYHADPGVHSGGGHAARHAVQEPHLSCGGGTGVPPPSLLGLLLGVRRDDLYSPSSSSKLGVSSGAFGWTGVRMMRRASPVTVTMCSPVFARSTA